MKDSDPLVCCEKLQCPSVNYSANTATPISNIGIHSLRVLGHGTDCGYANPAAILVSPVPFASPPMTLSDCGMDVNEFAGGDSKAFPEGEACTDPPSVPFACMAGDQSSSKSLCFRDYVI